ncbi:glutamate--tRNA ligase [Candidatus Pacearchaeota archaeon]|nr:glutamate--tRNA ligase [Candidatus Pacearchaeota archaeon]
MRDFSKEILAYALSNALEHGKADAGRVLTKLFQHGLDRKEIPLVMKVITKTVDEVNSMNVKEREELFSKMNDVVKKHDKTEDYELPELPPSPIGNKVVLRLAPFPSGAMHLGNTKTYMLNALYAEKYKGDLLFVMDDTIGSVEKPIVKEAYDLIPDAFKWLGVNYKKIYYKSDRLEIYYEYAEKLIEMNKAYVCYCKTDELRQNRAEGKECSCRQYPIGIQKARWKEMFLSRVKEGEASLRLKTDMQHPNPAFRDRVLFRIADRPHVRVGTKYRVWPTLEMCWAIDDHLLGITHIIRGNELMIESDMEKYIWDLFKWKHPVLIHVGVIRLEGVGAKISKSKAAKEVRSGEFSGWDDPRTWSVQSIARRGIRPEAIREFVKRIGLNKQDIVVPIEVLYAINRQIIDAETLRYSFVENPVKLNLSTEEMKGIDRVVVPVHPDRPEETREVIVSDDIAISGKDFEKHNGKEVRLLHLFNVEIGKESHVTSVDNKKIPKINWVSVGAVKTKILMPDGSWIEGFCEPSAVKVKVGTIIQFERFGFVRFDSVKDGVAEFWFSHP